MITLKEVISSEKQQYKSFRSGILIQDRPGLSDRSGPRGIVLSVGRFCNFLALFRPYLEVFHLIKCLRKLILLFDPVNHIFDIFDPEKVNPFYSQTFRISKACNLFHCHQTSSSHFLGTRNPLHNLPSIRCVTGKKQFN